MNFRVLTLDLYEVTFKRAQTDEPVPEHEYVGYVELDLAREVETWLAGGTPAVECRSTSVLVRTRQKI